MVHAMQRFGRLIRVRLVRLLAERKPIQRLVDSQSPCTHENGDFDQHPLQTRARINWRIKVARKGVSSRATLCFPDPRPYQAPRIAGSRFSVLE